MAAHRLRHPAGRSGPPGARRDGAEGAGARGAGGRGRRPRRPDVAGVLPANCRVRSFGARTQARPRAAVRRGAGGGARPGRARRGRRAHVPDLRGAGRAARPSARRAACCSGTRTGARRRTLRLAERALAASCSASTGAPSRSTRAKVRAIGHGIDLAEFACARNGAGHSGPARGRARPLLAGEGARRSCCAALRLALDDGLDVRLEVHGPALNPEERAHRGELERLVGELELEPAGQARPRGAAGGGARRARASGRARQQHARRRDRQGRLRGVRELPAGDRVEPGLRHAARARAPLRPRGRRGSSPTGWLRSADSRRRSAGSRAGDCARASSRRTRSTRGRTPSWRRQHDPLWDVPVRAVSEGQSLGRGRE